MLAEDGLSQDWLVCSHWASCLRGTSGYSKLTQLILCMDLKSQHSTLTPLLKPAPAVTPLCGYLAGLQSTENTNVPASRLPSNYSFM